MDKRQLDLNKPLLSVRRIPKLGYRSAMSGEIVQRSQTERCLVPMPCQYSDSNTMQQVTKLAAVPFVWEHIPGRSKSISGPLYFPRDEQKQLPSVSPKFRPGRLKDRVSVHGHKDEFDELYVQKPLTRAPSPIIRARTMFERSEANEYEESSPHLDNDENDEFADALDTLLPEETFSMNCSVSGLSGDEGSNATSSKNFSIDRQTQVFLMNRFLPAAKAMTLETPQYAVRKQPATVEEPKQAKRLLNVERKPHPQLKQYESRIVPPVGQLVVNQSESDDESCDCDSPIEVSVKACGFLPKFCLKNSLAIINQMTDVKSRSQSPKVTRIKSGKVAKSPSTQRTTPTRVTDKNAWEASHRRILERKAEQQKLAEVNIDNQIDQYLKSNAALEANRVSPYRNSVRGNISPYRNQRPPSPFQEGVGFLGIPKEAEKSKVMDGSLNNVAGSKYHDVLPPVEKTLYIDYVNPVKKSDYSLEEIVKRGVEPIQPAKKKAIGPESIPHVMKRLKELSFSKREATGSFLATRPSLSGISCARDRSLVEPRLDRKPGSLAKVSTEENLNVPIEKYAKDEAASNLALIASPLPPPLPKLPSESWLWRTLPSMPSKNPFSGLKRSLSKPSSPLAKWETMVKSSKLQNDHKRYSAELSTDVLKQYRK